MQRLRRHDVDAYDLTAQRYRESMRALSKKTKRQKWLDLWADIDGNSWDQAYQLVMKWLGRRLPILMEERARSELARLFPCGERVLAGPTAFEQRQYTVCEVISAINRLQYNRSSDPDGIPAAVLKDLARRIPRDMVDVANQGLRTGSFPACRKEAKLVFLPKPSVGGRSDR